MERLWKNHLLTDGRCQLEYKTQLNHPGLPWMVFFHGFGQNSHAFEPLFHKWKSTYNLLSVHIFYHGNSILYENEPLTKAEWKRTLAAVLEQEGIAELHITAFSMGCKFALVTAELMADRILGLTLLAPDGFIMNPWYRFATQTKIGRILLKTSVLFFPFFKSLLWVLGKLHVVTPSLHRFATSMMAQPEQRKLVLQVWIRFREIWPDWQLLSHLFDVRKIEVRVILGRHDSIIRIKKFDRQKSEWRALDWKILDTGHSGVVQHFASGLA